MAGGGGDVVVHHNILRDVFAQFCYQARLCGQLEAGHGYGGDSTNSRPGGGFLAWKCPACEWSIRSSSISRLSAC